MGGERTKTIGDVRRSAGRDGGAEGEMEVGVSLPDSVEWSVVRKVEEVSSGEAGN